MVVRHDVHDNKNVTEDTTLLLQRSDKCAKNRGVLSHTPSRQSGTKKNNRDDKDKDKDNDKDNDEYNYN